ncbi:MAG: ABC transporter permease [Bdellovibrionales bacterium]|nr:ABC transporter permease [Bdellovibrionales bacterium]
MSANTFQFRRVKAIAKKEFAHIMRDKFTLSMALVLPLIIVLVFGVAIEFNQSNISMAILDQDKTPSSRQLIENFSSSNYFSASYVFNINEGEKKIESEQAKTVLVIPPHFEKDILSGRGSDIQVLVNAADNSTAGSIISYIGQIQQRANQSILHAKAKFGLQLESRFLFNPELNSRWFTVPGLMVIIMTMIAILLTALTIAKEWEFGSMELLLSTPVSPLEIIIGKMTPYAALCMIAVLIVYLFARFVFDVPFRGNLFVYLFGCVLFLVTYLAQGLMISVITRKQMLAMQVSMLTGLLPSQLLSGFIFPVENMPQFFQNLTYILPARWFMEISRESFLQGASLWQMKKPFFALLILMILFVVIALKKFKKDLEP